MDFLRLVLIALVAWGASTECFSQGFIYPAKDDYRAQFLREHPEDGSFTVFSRFVSDHVFRRYSPEGLLLDTLDEAGYLIRPVYKFKPDGYEVFTSLSNSATHHVRIFENRNLRGQVVSETILQAPLTDKDEFIDIDKKGNYWIYAYAFGNSDLSYLIKLDENGKEILRTSDFIPYLFNRVYPKLYHLDNGGILATNKCPKDTSSTCLVRLDEQGNYLWNVGYIPFSTSLLEVEPRPDGKGFFVVGHDKAIYHISDEGLITDTLEDSGSLRLINGARASHITPESTLRVFGSDRGGADFVIGTLNEHFQFTEEFRQANPRVSKPRLLVPDGKGGSIATYLEVNSPFEHLGVMRILPNNTIPWRSIMPYEVSKAVKDARLTSKEEVVLLLDRNLPRATETILKLDYNGKVPLNTYKAAGYWRDVDNCKSRGYQTLKEKLSVKDLSGAYLLRYADKGHRFEWKSTGIDANVAFSNSTDRFTYCKNPEQRIVFASIDQEKEDSIFMAPKAHCATIRYGAVLHDALPCSSTDLFIELSNEGNDITALLDVKVILGDAYEGIESCEVPYADLGNKTYLLQVSELGEMGPGYLVRIPMKVKVSCAAREGDNACVQFELSGARICEDEVFPEILPQKEQCAFVKESLPNETLRTFVAGKETARMIPAEGVLQFQVRFNNITGARVHTVTIRDTLPEELDITTFKTHLSSHDYNLQILNNRIIIFTMRWLDLPDESKNSIKSQGYVAYTLNTKKGLAPGTIFQRRVGVYYDLTRVATPGMELEIEGPSNAAELQKNGHALAVYPQPSQGPLTVDCATCTEPQPYTLQLWNAHGQLVHRELLQQGRAELLVKTPGYYVLQISDAYGASARQKVLVQP